MSDSHMTPRDVPPGNPAGAAPEVSPTGDYATAVRFADLVFTAGMTPRTDSGGLAIHGTVGEDVSLSEARHAAALAARRALRAAAVHCEPARSRAVSLTVYVRCDASFTRMSEVADAASAVITEGTAGSAPVRAAVGVVSLPGGAPVELSLVLGAVAAGSP